ncbi:MAG: hypothetical protein KJ847_00190 [Firmicutes bacterium]|nr:hypothetical protein [Bacillota bacterium]
MSNNILEDIQKTAYDFFKDFTNFDTNSKAFGLTLDHSMNLEKATIASTGFMLSSLIIGVKHDYLSYEDAYHKAYHTLITLRDHVMHEFGFFAHFLDFKTGKRIGKTEFSTIDTALCLCGVLAVDSFFKDSKISEITKTIMDRINWDIFSHEYSGKQVLHMAYNPDRGGDYVVKRPGFIHQWDMFAEQLMMYVMIGGSKYKHLAKDLYQGFSRVKGSYKDFEYIYTPGNSLFVYQFPQAWLNLKNIYDSDQICWFDNARVATLAHQACAIDYASQYKTFSKFFFGFTASDTPVGYRVYGGLPNTMNRLDTDGTIAPFGPIGSIIFTPEISIPSIHEMMKIDHIWGKYGFYDAFNFEGNTPWVSKRYFSINKGLEMLMVNAYLYHDVHDAFMSHPIILEGMEVLGWKSK